MCPVILTIQQVVVKGYHECPFSVEVGKRFVAQKKRGSGDRGNVLKVVNTIHNRGQLGHVQRELVAPLWPSKNETNGKVTLLSHVLS